MLVGGFYALMTIPFPFKAAFPTMGTRLCAVLFQWLLSSSAGSRRKLHEALHVLHNDLPTPSLPARANNLATSADCCSCFCCCVACCLQASVLTVRSSSLCTSNYTHVYSHFMSCTGSLNA